MERCPSGRRSTPGERVGVYAPPGFESQSLRQLLCGLNNIKVDFATLIRYIAQRYGGVAQLGERLVRNEEVGGSSPLISTDILKRDSRLGTVLDGELAVPCDPQSAIAGLNSLRRS